MNLTPHSAPKMNRPPRYRHKIGSFHKNSLERVEVELTEYNGVDLCNIAVVRDDSGRHSLNGMKGTARYVSLGVRHLDRLISDLTKAREHAHAMGLLGKSTEERP